MRWSLWRIPLQTKLMLIYAGVYVAFAIYFAVTLALTARDQTIMSKLVANDLPVLELTGRLAREVATMRHQFAKTSETTAASMNMAIEGLHRATETDFHDLRDLEPSHQGDIDVLHAQYMDVRGKALAASQAMLDSVATDIVRARLSEQLDGFQRVEQTLTRWKDVHERQLRESVEDAKGTSRSEFIFGVLLFTMLIPFTLIVYRMLRGLNDELLNASHRLREASDKILGLATNAQASSEELSETGAKQAASVLQTVAGMEEMKSMLSRTLSHSESAMRASGSSFEEAQRGKAVVQSMREAMTAIEHSYHELGAFRTLVVEIRGKTEVIDNITFKTQLLSFNASIEAARAGTHGRGFAVVAEEVGNLAKSSSIAAIDIDKMLEQSLAQVTETMARAKQTVDQALELSRACTGAFERITERTGQTKTLVVEIQEASSEQYSGIQNVDSAMTDLSISAQQANSLANSMAGLARVLKTESDALSTTVNALDVLMHGTHSLSGLTQLFSARRAGDSEYDSAA